jgi:hypothetical protein
VNRALSVAHLLEEASSSPRLNREAIDGSKSARRPLYSTSRSLLVLVATCLARTCFGSFVYDPSASSKVGRKDELNGTCLPEI